MKTILLNLFFLTIVISGAAQEKKLLRKAAIATDRMKYEEALKYYDQALELDKNSYRANAGKGMLLAEFMERYDEALPYLETALQNSPKDTLVRIFYTLGKSYHYIGDYEEALTYYKKVEPYNEIGEENFQTFLQKRIADCKYAAANNVKAPKREQYIVNLGNSINSTMPEYSSIYTKEKELIFTSKRQDDPKEKKNAWDGKFFESMYISRLEDGKYTEPRRYTLPDKNGDSKFAKYNEAAVSALPDGSMFLYKNGKLYHSGLNEKNEKPDKLDKTINFSSYQNHACMSPDGNTIYFTSESKNGLGGTDIFRSDKAADGNWLEPVMLDTTINTQFDEASPYMGEDGILYFSSNGHPGYGGFDVYKTKFVDGHWIRPENLGQPINSPANDLFFTLDISSTAGHYSSNRMGGYGDMDVYRVNYSVNEKPDCDKPDDPLLAIQFIPQEGKSMSYIVELKLPENYSGNFTSTSWKLNDSVIQHTSKRFPYTFSQPGSYTFEAKVVTACDTCVEIFTACRSERLVIDDQIMAGNNDNKQNDNQEDGKQDDSKQQNNNQALAAEPGNKGTSGTESPEGSGNENTTGNTDPVNITLQAVYFDYDAAEIRPDAAAALNNNIQVLKSNKNLNVAISGNADCRGTSEYNKELSRKRAVSVKNYLLNHGIEKNRIAGLYSLGESSPVNNCNDGASCSEEEYQQNRRTEFKVLLKSKGQDAVSTFAPIEERP